MSRKKMAIFGAVIGTVSIVVFGYFTSAWAAIALFFVLWGNNLSLSRYLLGRSSAEWQPIETAPTDSVILLRDKHGNRWSGFRESKDCGFPAVLWMELPE